jgi:hypothetical protein
MFGGTIAGARSVYVPAISKLSSASRGRRNHVDNALAGEDGGCIKSVAVAFAYAYADILLLRSLSSTATSLPATRSYVYTKQ